MTGVTGKSSQKTYISHLERQLQDEKDAREKLEKEILEIKRLNQEITTKLGLTPDKTKH
jgi:predicted RNase H-like nuclease (RuvC/YqgF family)